MKRILVLTLGAALALSFATAAHAGSNHGSTSTTCPDKQTTTTRAPSSTTSSLPSTTSTSEPTSTTATTEPSSTTSTTVEDTTTTAPATTTTVAETTTTAAPTTTTVLDDVELIPPIFITSGDIDRLPETGFPYWNVTLFALGVLALGFAGLLIREMASR